MPGFFRAVNKYFEDLEGEFEYRDVVNPFADELPGVAEAGDAAAEGLPDGGNVVVRGGEAVLEGEGVEEDEAADTQGGGAVFFLVGLGDDVGDATGQAGVLGDRASGLFEGVTHHSGGGGDTIDVFEVQGEGAEFIGEFADGALPDGRLGPGRATGAVQPPLEVGGFKPGPGVFGVPELFGIENAEVPRAWGKSVRRPSSWC